MATLHYGPQLHIELDISATRQAMEAIEAHATRGGWVTVTDTTGRHWSLLISAGIPIWLTDECDPAAATRSPRISSPAIH